MIRAAPQGFRVEIVSPRHVLYLCDDEERLADWRAAGLDEPATWRRVLAGPAQQSGRGRVARVAVGGARRLVLKQLRRGGLLAPLWRERFLGHRRALNNLVVPSLAVARGVPTPRVVALLLEATRKPLYRAWLASEELPEAIDLAALLRESNVGGAAFDAAIGVVHRMHEAGLDHPDLNLGNLAVKPRGAEWEAYVLDLDRARLAGGPLPLRPRIRALRRIERSYVKHFGSHGPLGLHGSRRAYRVYAGTDRDLLRRLERARRAGRLALALHRLGWRQSRAARPGE